MRRFLFLLFSLVLLSATAQEISLIPQPAKVEVKEGAFLLKKGTVLYVDAAVKNVAEQFAATIHATTGVKLKISNYNSFDKRFNSRKPAIYLIVVPDMSDEEYALDVRDNFIFIEATKPAGFFYALQTLKQLMPRNVMAGVPDDDIKE